MVGFVMAGDMESKVVWLKCQLMSQESGFFDRFMEVDYR